VLLEVIGLRMGLGLPTYVAHLDLEKAYDSVNFDHLRVVLASHGIGGASFGLRRNVFRGTIIAVRTGRGKLRFQHPIRGLKQGCPLSCQRCRRASRKPWQHLRWRQLSPCSFKLCSG